MAAELEGLRILKVSEEIADTVWKQVMTWDEFTNDVVGKQMAGAIDSIGALLISFKGVCHDQDL